MRPQHGGASTARGCTRARLVPPAKTKESYRTRRSGRSPPSSPLSPADRYATKEPSQNNRSQFFQRRTRSHSGTQQSAPVSSPHRYGQRCTRKADQLPRDDTAEPHRSPQHQLYHRPAESVARPPAALPPAESVGLPHAQTASKPQKSAYGGGQYAQWILHRNAPPRSEYSSSQP